MAIVFMTDPDTGRVALYDEPNTTGALDDPNSPRNAPLNNPSTNLEYLYFHSDFNYLEVLENPTIVVNHAEVSVTPAPTGATINFGWNGGANVDRLLYTHNLGYAPIAIAAVNGNVLWPGVPVQSTGNGGVRFVTLYVTNTEVRLKEFGTTGPTALPAISLSYNLIVFKNPPSSTGTTLFEFEPVSGVVEMGLGKFRSDRRYLQVVPGGTPFSLSYGGRTIDLANGAPRAIRADGAAFDPIPSSLGIALSRVGLTGTNFGWIYGSGMNYTGSYSFSGNIQVQAP